MVEKEPTFQKPVKPEHQPIAPGEHDSSETDNAHLLCGSTSESDENQNDSSSRIGSSIHLEPRAVASSMSYPPSVPHADDSEESSMLHQNDCFESPHASDCTPFPAKMIVVGPLILGNLCLICTLAVLWHLSQSRHGLFVINLQTSKILPLWHFLPMVITMGTLVVSAVWLRCQLYLHLLRKGGANANDSLDSLTLDYNGPSFVVLFKGIHWHQVFMFFVMLPMLLMLSVLYFPG